MPADGIWDLTWCLKAYIHVFIDIYLLRVLMFVIPSSGRLLSYLPKTHMLFAVLLCRLAVKVTIYRVFFFLIYDVVTVLKENNVYFVLYFKNLHNVS